MPGLLVLPHLVASSAPVGHENCSGSLQLRGVGCTVNKWEQGVEGLSVAADCLREG